MRIDGQWLLSDDGVLRPVIRDMRSSLPEWTEHQATESGVSSMTNDQTPDPGLADQIEPAESLCLPASDPRTLDEMKVDYIKLRREIAESLEQADRGETFVLDPQEFIREQRERLGLKRSDRK